MSDLIVYLLKVSGTFSSLVFFYFVFLRRLTFHAFNRAILLTIIPFSLALPLLSFNIQSSMVYDLNEVEWVGFAGEKTATGIEAVPVKMYLDYFLYLELVYGIGLGVGLFLLVFNATKLFHQLRTSRKVYSSGFSVLQSEVPTVFSCFKWIFVPKNHMYGIDDPIIKHEQAHIRLFHSYDLIIVELFIAFTWFNPFVFLFRKLLRSVHEFQADEYVLSGSIKRSDYLSLMLESLVSKDQFSFSSSFKSLTIKNRIEMVTKNKSQKMSMMRYVFIAPVIVLMLMAFSDTKGTKPSIKPIKEGEYERMSSGFGMRTHPIDKVKRMHTGVDFATPKGTPIRATGDGYVSMVKSAEKGHGKQIVVSHGSGYASFYANLSEFAVKEGQFVRKSEIIAYSGNTGRSTAPHLHYEVRLNGKPVNPANYFTDEN